MMRLFQCFIFFLFGFSSVFCQPANDNFSDRVAISSIPVSFEVDNQSATTEPDDLAAYRSLWWKFTPDKSGNHYITMGPVYSPYLVFGVYTGNSINTLVLQSGKLQGGSPPYTRVYEYALTAGVEYTILFGSSRSWDRQDLIVEISDNEAPQVSITNPIGTSVYYAGDQLELRVNATDVDGSITRVDYYIGSHVLGAPDASSST